MAEFADSAVGNEGQDTATDFQVEATDGGFVSLPDGFSLSDATFETDGQTPPDGARGLPAGRRFERGRFPFMRRG